MTKNVKNVRKDLTYIKIFCLKIIYVTFFLNDEQSVRVKLLRTFFDKNAQIPLALVLKFSLKQFFHNFQTHTDFCFFV